MMAKFLKYLTIFMLPILLLGFGLEIILRSIPNDYASKNKYLEENSNKIKWLFLGNSHVYYGIDPQFLSVFSFNAAYISQSLDLDLKLLENHNDKWDSLKSIIITVDYFSFNGKLEDGLEGWRIKNYNIYHDFSAENGIIYNTEVLSNKLNVNFNRIRNYYYNDISNISCSDLGWGKMYTSKMQKDLLVTGKEEAKRHRARHPENFDEMYGILRSMLEFAKARKVKVLLFTAPAYKSYVQNLDQAQLNRVVNAANQLAKAYDNTVYINLLTDVSFTKDDFYDGDHLNEIGAKKLTIKIDSIQRSLNKSLE